MGLRLPKEGDAIVRFIRIVLTLIMLVVCVIIPGIIMLFQPKILKVNTGTPLTEVSSFEVAHTNLLYVTPKHRLVGTAKLPYTYGMSFIVVPMDGLQPNFDEMQSFYLGDVYDCGYLEQNDGFYFLRREREDVVYRHADILDWYELLWLDCTDGSMTTIDKMEAAGIPAFLETENGQVLLSWQGENSAYINHYDSNTQRLTAIEPAEVWMSSFTPTSLGNGQYLGFWRDYGGNFQEESLDVEMYLILSNEQGDLLDSYPCDKDYTVAETYVVGNRAYALLNHRDKPQYRLMTMDLDKENGKLMNVHCYTLPKISGSKLTTYSTFNWKEGVGLQVLFMAPHTWDSGASTIGAATIIDDGEGGPNWNFILFWNPNATYQHARSSRMENLFIYFRKVTSLFSSNNGRQSSRLKNGQ